MKIKHRFNSSNKKLLNLWKAAKLKQFKKNNNLLFQNLKMMILKNKLSLMGIVMIMILNDQY